MPFPMAENLVPLIDAEKTDSREDRQKTVQTAAPIAADGGEGRKRGAVRALSWSDDSAEDVGTGVTIGDDVVVAALAGPAESRSAAEHSGRSSYSTPPPRKRKRIFESEGSCSTPRTHCDNEDISEEDTSSGYMTPTKLGESICQPVKDSQARRYRTWSRHIARRRRWAFVGESFRDYLRFGQP